MSPGYTESKTDRLVNCKAGWASPNSIKKHMFFKKCSWTVRTSIQKQYHFPICKDGEENGMKPVFMFALQCFFYVHPLSLYSGLCYLHFLMFFFRGIGIHHDNEPPRIQPGFNEQSAGVPGQHSARTQFKKTVTERVWNSIFRGKQLLKMCSTEWDGWRIFHRLSWMTRLLKYYEAKIVDQNDCTVVYHS